MTRTDSGAATVHAAVAEVFAALVDPASRASWLPPAGMTGRIDWFDARAGGGYRMVLAYDDPAGPGKSGGNTDVVEARFVVVEAPTRVVEEVDFVSDDPRFAGTMTMTWTLEAVPSGTLVTITATDVPEGIDGEVHRAAFASTLSQMDAYLRARPGRSGR
ncbi:hypothetical protein I601_3605 [Nocardioides dokdonensis FR1436]|uniref:Activator of Hsp90 ATPase homologue 1/2-like C-terminal domain-containing protein n=1 Tax=Nocardioides dokdonensis FR1436 TaxID=1300347 RepID=A0A1A9GRA6_9ACTN|nr:SRPBCC domain-containing protein [Nocardioides dokdonensis]ANH40011.1 hypothetical protein I601_3605 [Nocardioides dokdonensis FR1436]